LCKPKALSAQTSCKPKASSACFTHRYTSSSTAIKHFLEILSAMDAADQRRFLRFVTGSPRLRPGGLSALHPRWSSSNFRVHSGVLQSRRKSSEP